LIIYAKILITINLIYGEKMINIKHKAIEFLQNLTDGDKEELYKSLEHGYTCCIDVVPEIYQKDFEKELKKLLFPFVL